MPLLHLILAFAGVLLIAVTLPLALELLVFSLGALFPAARPRIEAEPAFRLAVVIPAHNEQALIGNCIRSLASAPEIYAVAHNCSDATAAVASEAGAKVLILNDETGGKGVALDFGFAHALAAGAQAVLVVDADSIAGANLIPAVTYAFSQGADALQCRYQVANAVATPRTRLAALAFLGMNVLRPLGRSRLGLSCGIFGNGFALSARTLARVPYTANSLVEDLEYHLHLIRAGIRVEFLNHAAVFGEMPEHNTAAATQRARWEGGRILMRRLWTRPLALEVLRGRLRMLEPLLDLLALPLATEAAALMLGILFGIGAHLVWLTGYACAGLFSIVLYVLVASTLAPDTSASLRAIAAAPGYMFWKVLLIPKTRLAARRDAQWVRTKRNAEPGDPPER